MARFGKIGWFLGLIFGSIFGILFAPRKGKELRQRIKSDRKKGKLGIAPLQEDIREFGLELAGIAKEIYQSETVQDIIVRGRKKMKKLSGELVSEAVDFQKTRIEPIKRKAKRLERKVKASAKIGEKAIKKITGVMKKKAK